jgi:nitric oxide reductase NorD protein
MELEQLKCQFFELVAPDLPNEWDVEEAMESLEGISEEHLAAAFGQVPVIWPVSNSLCFSYLTQVAAALNCIEPGLLPQWVNETLDYYERSGLKAAQRFMMDVQGNFVCSLHGKSGLRYSQVKGRLLPYVRGLAKGNLDLQRADRACTDTLSIFLPREISLFANEDDNLLLYKLIASFQWSYIALDSFFVSRNQGQPNPSAKGILWLQNFFSGFNNPTLIADIYHGLETLRVKVFLDQELPGLMRDAGPILAKITASPAGKEKTGFLFSIVQQLVLSQEVDQENYWFKCVKSLLTYGTTAHDSLDLAEDIYNDLSPEAGEYQRIEPLSFQGRMQLEQVASARLEQRREQENLFVESLATVLLTLPPVSGDVGDDEEVDAGHEFGQAAPPEEAVAMVIAGSRTKSEEEENKNPRFITIDNREIELSEELAELAAAITRDLGTIPDQYIASAAGKAGQGTPGLTMSVAGDGAELSAPITYDEWDFRRSGFRLNWCIVTEKEIPITRSTLSVILWMPTTARLSGYGTSLK